MSEPIRILIYQGCHLFEAVPIRIGLDHRRDQNIWTHYPAKGSEIRTNRGSIDFEPLGLIERMYHHWSVPPSRSARHRSGITPNSK